jgi:hypothetical protein
MTTGRQLTRLLRLLNYLGILNVVGILCIVLSEHSPPTTPSFPLLPSYQSVEHKKNRPTNRHKGINETILLLERAGVDVDVDYPRLPPWWWIEDQYGDQPKILGLDRCEHFRTLNRAHPDDIHIAPSGLFNSGTNLLYQLLQANCHFPDRDPDAYHGRAFQPPWGKHTPREFRESHRIEHVLYQSMIVDAILPVVLIRHPYDWLKSVCEQPYAVHWRDRDQNKTIVCPLIVHPDNKTQEVMVTYGSGNQGYESIAHLWNRWNRGYYDSMAFPRLMVRMEDLIFYPDKVVPEICGCAGGSLIHPERIQIPLESAKKDTSGHQQKLSTTYLQAVIKYGNIRTWERFPLWDHLAARAILDKELMQVFGYDHPDLTKVMRNKARTGLD